MRETEGGRRGRKRDRERDREHREPERDRETKRRQTRNLTQTQRDKIVRASERGSITKWRVLRFNQ